MTIGANSMIPLIVHSPAYPALISNRLVTKQDTLMGWIPFGANGNYLNAYSNMPEVGLENRTLPEQSVVYENQSVEVNSYSVESYETIPALGQVVHARLNVNREARVSLSIYDPNLIAYPLYYRNPSTGEHEPASNLTLAAGTQDLEFVAMNYADVAAGTGKAKLFTDGLGTGAENKRYFRVRFEITDPRTNRTVVKWASCKILL
jgi:hypothetical protein